MTPGIKSVLAAISLTVAGNVAAAQATPAEKVARSLAAEMSASAATLEAGKRHEGTKPLDRALHLAEFAEQSAEVGTDVFRNALEALKAARHELQMGRPEQAVARLTDGARALEQTPGGLRLGGVDPDRLDEIEGLPVLNLHGHELGEIVGFTQGENGAIARVEHGDFIFFGGNETPLEADRLLSGGGFVVLPEDILPEAFES
ncbi:hypothetical protein [Tranquillimonas alkanivorans]|uniref:PRC-barrel domain-containing protein n=1 Tax=Tranquillimonas alkanivorans TaxID=441119 RepID=A0A1I5WY77_9RHOB|nr:hypothetical protein [Tranquillimonas alkanivorans]SFQ24669.1 hypothetical protein SAMN04488047_1653 [Tranquillimonas alkanivorans]